MRIAFISDLHFGFGRGTERSEDCWEAAAEAFEKARECDLIVLPGDIFDDKIPRPEDWAKALKIFAENRVPVVAIHGTHERRGRGLLNCVQGLDHAGFLKHVHCSSATYEFGRKKVTVHGMSGVPEAYAKEVLMQWDPKPVEGINIFMLHQSIHPYIYNPIEPPSLKLEDLPEGFDLYVSGHIHWREKTEIRGKPFIIPGSTVTTQVNKTEAKFPKGFYVADFGKKLELKFVELERQRKVFYKDFKMDVKSDLLEEIDGYLAGICTKEGSKPLVRVRVRGRKCKGTEINLSQLREKYRNRMLLSIASRFSEEEMAEKMGLMRDIRESRVSIEEMGFRILRENMKELGVDRGYEEIFELLVEGNVDAALVSLIANSENQESNSMEMGGVLAEEPEEERGDAGNLRGETEKEDLEEELMGECLPEKTKNHGKNLFDWSKPK